MYIKMMVTTAILLSFAVFHMTLGSPIISADNNLQLNVSQLRGYWISLGLLNGNETLHFGAVFGFPPTVNNVNIIPIRYTYWPEVENYYATISDTEVLLSNDEEMRDIVQKLSIVAVNPERFIALVDYSIPAESLEPFGFVLIKIDVHFDPKELKMLAEKVRSAYKENSGRLDIK